MSSTRTCLWTLNFSNQFSPRPFFSFSINKNLPDCLSTSSSRPLLPIISYQIHQPLLPFFIRNENCNQEVSHARENSHFPTRFREHIRAPSLFFPWRKLVHSKQLFHWKIATALSQHGRALTHTHTHTHPHTHTLSHADRCTARTPRGQTTARTRVHTSIRIPCTRVRSTRRRARLPTRTGSSVREVCTCASDTVARVHAHTGVHEQCVLYRNEAESD